MATLKSWPSLDGPSNMGNCQVSWPVNNGYISLNHVPLGLYEWLAMPMGLKNSPPIHQRRMVAALRHLIGKICHVYLDDIVIWSNSVAEHAKHIDMVMRALADAKLHLNPK